METPSGIKDSIPAWIKYSVQAPGDIPYNGIYYDPPEEVFILAFCNFRFQTFLLDSKNMVSHFSVLSSCATFYLPLAF
jgi:hypothetical protein